MSGPGARVLLIGNSRWHWAEIAEPDLTGGHAPTALAAASESGEPGPGSQDPDDQPRSAAGQLQWPGEAIPSWIPRDEPSPIEPTWEAAEILAWAAVGPVPEALAAHLPAERRLSTDQVPLEGTPTWLGVDRALVAWQAWRRQQLLEPAPVLVADAGTVLSLTLVDRQGRFLGGRLLAGAALQWRAMAAETALLPALQLGNGSSDPWPQATAAAMEIGVVHGLSAAVAQAFGQLQGGQGMTDLRLWLCGGDGPCLAPLLRAAGVPVIEAPHLAMEALIALVEVSPGRDR